MAKLFQKIDDIIIKTIISAESLLYSGVDMFVPNRCNCFELLGFDILVDDNIEPWLLEVNLSPSLSCDFKLDLDIKGALISDTLTLAGFVELGKRSSPNANSSSNFNSFGSMGCRRSSSNRFESSEDRTFGNILKRNFLTKKQ